MQSLALDVNVVSEEGQRAEMRDEDDDLLRAAEELGIDLSGVRVEDEPPPGEVAATPEGDEAEDTEDEDLDESEVDLDVVSAVGVLGAEDSLDDLGIELDLDALAGDEDIDEDVVTTDEESA